MSSSSHPDFTPRFPRELLNASPEDRVAYFKQAAVEHPKFNDVLNKVDELLDPCLDERVVLLVGATGVGKSAICKQLVKRRKRAKRREMEEDPYLIPALGLEAEPPARGPFNMSALHVAMLHEMRAPLIEASTEFQERLAAIVKLNTIAAAPIRRQHSDEGVKQRARAQLVARKVELCAIDEAGLIFTLGRVRTKLQAKLNFQAQAAKLRSLVNRTPTSLLLAGAYDFFEVAQASGQLARRSRVVHFEPYGLSNDDLIGFCKGLIGLLAQLPAHHSIDPLIHSGEICLHTAGCIGIASDLLKAALVSHIKTGRSLDIAHVRQHYLSAAALKTIREEIADGADQMAALLESPELPDEADGRPSQNDSSDVPKHTLKPGDTRPDHRAHRPSNGHK